MSDTPAKSFSIDVTLFGSKVDQSAMAATSLPPGASPANADCYSIPGQISSRPALQRVFPYPITQPNSISSQITVVGNAAPWTEVGSNPTVPGIGSGAAATTFPVTPGTRYAVQFTGGVVIPNGFPAYDATGMPWSNGRATGLAGQFVPDDGTVCQGSCAIGTWQDGSGNIIGTPFALNDYFGATAPAGAAVLAIGVNSLFTNWADNSGQWTFEHWTDLAGNASQILALKEFQPPSGDWQVNFIDFAGEQWSTSPIDAAPCWLPGLIQWVRANSFFQAEDWGNRQWYAYFEATGFQGSGDATLSANFCGRDIPRYWDGEQLRRVTHDAPGVGPGVVAVQVPGVPLTDIVVSGYSSTVTMAESSGARTVTTPVYTIINGHITITYKQVTGYSTLTLTVGTAPTAALVGQTIQVTGFGSPVDGSYTVVSVNIPGSTITVTPGTGTAFIDVTGTGSIVVSSATYAIQRLNNQVYCPIGATNIVPEGIGIGDWVSVQNTASNNITGPVIGPNWSVTSMTQDSNGVVTVTLSTPLPNLPPGAVLYLDADPSDPNFASGYITVTDLLSVTATTTVFQWQSQNPVVATAIGSPLMYQQWCGLGGTYGNAAQIQAIEENPGGLSGWYVVYYQLGPDVSLPTSSVTDAVLLFVPQIPAGPRSTAISFLLENGEITAPSVPVNFVVPGWLNASTTGLSTNYMQVGTAAAPIPLGPAGTVGRILEFTPAYGDNWYYLEPFELPAIAGLPPISLPGTIVMDNTTTSLVVDFSDNELVGGIQIDTDGNNLFSCTILAPCLGVREYSNRLMWFGEQNAVKNLINPTIDGGYIARTGFLNYTNGSCSGLSGLTVADIGAQIQITGVPADTITTFVITNVGAPTSCAVHPQPAATVTGAQYTIFSPAGYPLGWQVSDTGANGNLIQREGVRSSEGLAYQITADGSTISGNVGNGLIYQPCDVDYLGTPILIPSTPYMVRLIVEQTNQTANGDLIVDVYNPAYGVLAQAVFPLGTIAVPTISALGPNWYSQPLFTLQQFPGESPSQYPSGTIVRAYLTGASSNTVTIDEITLIDISQPVNLQQARLSYEDNPFNYDGVTGIINLGTQDAITAAFRQRGYLYINSTGGLYQSQDNGVTEPNGWGQPTLYSEKCDAFGPNAVDTAGETAFWIGNYGTRLFDGSPEVTKISQEIQDTWPQPFGTFTMPQITQPQSLHSWLKVDTINRHVLIGIPTGGSPLPSQIIYIGYKMSNKLYNIPDPIHVSAISGRIIATDLARRTSPWTIAAGAADMCHIPNGNGGYTVGMLVGGCGVATATPCGNLYGFDFSFTKHHDDDGTTPINGWYQTYFFIAHDLEQQPILGLYEKIYQYLAYHCYGVGNLIHQAFMGSMNVAAAPFPLLPLLPGDMPFDFESKINVTDTERMSIRFGAIPAQATIMLAFSNGTTATYTVAPSADGQQHNQFLVGDIATVTGYTGGNSDLNATGEVIASTSSSFTIANGNVVAQSTQAGSAVGLDTFFVVSSIVVSCELRKTAPIRGTIWSAPPSAAIIIPPVY